jgi:hypothetical protein
MTDGVDIVLSVKQERPAGYPANLTKWQRCVCCKSLDATRSLGRDSVFPSETLSLEERQRFENEKVLAASHDFRIAIRIAVGAWVSVTLVRRRWQVEVMRELAGSLPLRRGGWGRVKS